MSPGMNPPHDNPNSKQRLDEKGSGNDQIFSASIAWDKDRTTSCDLNDHQYYEQLPSVSFERKRERWIEMPAPNESLNRQGMCSIPSSIPSRSLFDPKNSTTGADSSISNSQGLYDNNRCYFALFIYVLLKLLLKEQTTLQLRMRVKEIVRQCISSQKAGITGYSPLQRAIEDRLKRLDGIMSYWNVAEIYVENYMDGKRSGLTKGTVL